MLRLSVILLLLTNLLLAGWHLARATVTTVATPVAVPAPARPEPLPPIRLLADLSPAELEAMAQQQPPVPDSSFAGSTPALELPPAPDNAFAGSTPALELPVAETSAALLTVGHCWSVGPLESLTAQARVRGVLQTLGATIAERESEALVELGYWVALPPRPSFAEAAVTMRVLAASGLEDIAVVSDPLAGDEPAWRVSLGYFLDEGNARRRRDAVRELGFAAETRLQREPERRYWLDFSQAADAPEPAMALAAVIQPEQLRVIPCAPFTAYRLSP